MTRLDWMSFKEGDHIILYASKLAGCAGMHAYVSQDDLKREFKRSQGLDDTYETQHEKAQKEIAGLSVDQKDLIDNAIKVARNKETPDVREALSQLKVQLHVSSTTLSSVTSTLYTEHGTKKEDQVRQSTSRSMNEEIKQDNKFRISTTPIMVVNGIEVYLGGKHDGLVGEKVVEIKTRQRRFLGTPLYERIQVHAYMYIFGIRNSYIVESFDGQQKIHDVEFDDELWEGVKSGVFTFVEDLLI
jgi:hypothetical protein